MDSATDPMVGGPTTIPGGKETMRAIVYPRYGPPDVLELREVDKPVVGDDEVLIRVHSASVNPYDWHFMRGEPYLARMQMGLRPTSTRLGMDVAGTVDAVGVNVTGFQPGDEVFGWSHGSFAEYAIGREPSLVLKPASVSFEEAGAVGIAAFTAIQSLRDWGKVEAGQRVLINGAAGGVGTFAVQLAKVWGAEVTGVCSTRNVEMVRSIGADHVVDYTRDDFTRGERRYDLMLDMIGNHPVSKCLRVIEPKGTFVMLGGQNGRWIRPIERSLKTLAMSPLVSQSMVVRMVAWSKDDLVVMADLMKRGKVTPVIDRVYPLSQVPEAIRYLEGGHARGKVVISVAGTGQVSRSESV